MKDVRGQYWLTWQAHMRCNRFDSSQSSPTILVSKVTYAPDRALSPPYFNRNIFLRKDYRNHAQQRACSSGNEDRGMGKWLHRLQHKMFGDTPVHTLYKTRQSQAESSCYLPWPWDVHHDHEQ
ncbi:hypothetical protein EIP91_007305 [Steccherinum ochraceum]|uniref:Uncharacterized protein n=1 Tax=Steccherinum ochraceum TaxID=92696 RepID=A0A4R0R4A6_9APHY|nr:hypothetical protein EIP91_007305 [Steccherinum ochraceum]